MHGSTDGLSALAAALEGADLVIVSGDLTHFGGRRDAKTVIEGIRIYNRSILAVSGNCDHPPVETYLLDEGLGLHARYTRRAGYGFVGLGGSLPTPGGMTPNEYSEEELARFLEKAAAGLDTAAPSPFVLVSHQPPLDTKCDLVDGGHVGSRSVRVFIEKYQPLVCLSGHIHESRCIDTIGRTRIVNPGPLRDGNHSLVEIDGDGATVRLYHGSVVLDQGC
jgi:Icc-related predicted phosphoesterase